MHFLKKHNIDFMKAVKFSALGLAALVALIFVFSLLNATVRPLFERGIRAGISQVAPGAPSYGYATEDSAYDYGDESVKLSARNVVGEGGGAPSSIFPPSPDGTTGSTAEDFEVTDYSATIETRSLARVCGEVAALKAHDYVIFENANEYDRGCNYTFKVAHEKVAEVLAFVEALDPKDLSENTYTIKKRIDDFTSEAEILANKLASIDETLRSALRAYDEVTALATRTANAEALAKIIDSRVGVIERLSRERITVNAQLERLERAKRDQLDRLLYTYFRVNIYENKFVDGEQIADSWKAAVQEFVRDANKAVQDATVNLLGFLLLLAQYALYALILLFAAKYGWRFARDVWRK